MTTRKLVPQIAVRHSSIVNSIAAVALAMFFIGVNGAAGADLSQAVVRQKVNVVTLAASLQAAPRPAAQGSVVHDDNVVRTGTESRAELEFSDQTLARLGANSIFSFDAQTRALNCERGAILFSKPANSGRIEVRSGAITAAITGSTGFLSNQPGAAGTKKARRNIASSEEATTILGMLEGKISGNAEWRDSRGRQQIFHFRLGAGEMLMAQPGVRPVVVQFDLPRFIKTSPLITRFNHELLNPAALRRALADYESDQRRGFIAPVNVVVSTQPMQLGWVGYNPSLNHNSFDASVDQLGMSAVSPGGGFFNVGGTGILRGQLVWNTSADLDLHLILPDKQEVFFGNPTVIFNSRRATAMLDHDNLGGTIDVPPGTRIENITVNGVPLAGTYSFFVKSFTGSSSGSDPFTLRVSVGGRIQTLSGTLADGQNSAPIKAQFTPSSR